VGRNEIYVWGKKYSMIESSRFRVCVETLEISGLALTLDLVVDFLSVYAIHFPIVRLSSRPRVSANPWWLGLCDLLQSRLMPSFVDDELNIYEMWVNLAVCLTLFRN
jgi:hypothetical protein